MNKKGKITIIGASALALVSYFSISDHQKSSVKRKISSVSEPIAAPSLTKDAVEVSKKVVHEKKNKAALTTQAPAPYFLNSDNFKTYDKILYKVVRSPEEKQAFQLSLMNHRSLEKAADYLKSPSAKPGKEEKIYHLKASGFLIKAITAHPTEFDVTAAVKEVLDVNLSEAKNSMSESAYTMLKENKAELMYHALAVSEEIQNTYSADAQDKESQSLLAKVQALHTSNIELSKKMIADR